MVATIVKVTFNAPGIWIAFDAIGASFSLKRSGYDVTLSLPGEADSFSTLPKTYSQAPYHSLVNSGPVIEEPGWDGRTASVKLFEVAVEMESAIPEKKPAELSDELRLVVESDLNEGMEVAEEVAGAFLRHVRAAAPIQTWLGLATHLPTQYGIARLEYSATSEMIFGLGALQKHTVRSSRLRLTQSNFETIADHLNASEEPRVTDSLLADAWHLDEGTNANDRDRAVIIAAMACEIRTKQTIRGSVADDRRDLTEMVLKRRSNLPELLDEVLLAGCGVSLRHNDPTLFAYVKALSQQRNAIAHSGQTNPAAPDMAIPARVALQVFEWLEANVTARTDIAPEA